MTRRRWILIVGLAILLLIAAFFGLTASGRQLISTVLNLGNEKPVSYLCPVADLSGPVALADCTDCTYYPVDKTNGLPSNYQPNLIETGLPGGGRVAAIVRQPLHDLFADAQAQGFSPVVSSGYRSYDEQAATFRYWVFQEWQRTSNLFQAVTNAEHYSAWEGHSEHQLGTAVDINCIACEAFDDCGNIWKITLIVSDSPFLIRAIWKTARAISTSRGTCAISVLMLLRHSMSKATLRVTECAP